MNKATFITSSRQSPRARRFMNGVQVNTHPNTVCHQNGHIFLFFWCTMIISRNTLVFGRVAAVARHPGSLCSPGLQRHKEEKETPVGSVLTN